MLEEGAAAVWVTCMATKTSSRILGKRLRATLFPYHKQAELGSHLSKSRSHSQVHRRLGALKRLEPPTTSITDRIAPNFRVTAATCSREQLICADRRPAASTSSRVDGITPATMLQSGSNWTTH